MTPEQKKFVEYCEFGIGHSRYGWAVDDDMRSLLAIIREQEAWIKRAAHFLVTLRELAQGELVDLGEGEGTDLDKLLDESRGEQ